MSGPYFESIEKRSGQGSDDFSNLLRVMSLPERRCTRFAYISPSSSLFPTNVTDLLQHVEEESANGRRGVCVIENISPVCIETLGSAWRLDPNFFNMHASNSQTADFWHISHWKQTQPDSLWECLDGIFECCPLDIHCLRQLDKNYCERQIFVDRKDMRSVNWSTKLSYYRVSDYLYARMPCEEANPEPHPNLAPSLYRSKPFRAQSPELHFPYAQNYAGIFMPGSTPLSNTAAIDGRDFMQMPICVLFDVITQSSRFDYQIEFLFNVKKALPGPPLLYLLLSSAWGHELRFMDQVLELVSFQHIRRPDLGTTSHLHDIREYLHFARKHISLTKTYVPDEVRSYFVSLINNTRELSKMHSPIQHVDENLQRVDRLRELVTETFNLLVSTLAVEESRRNGQQAEQSIILSRLAALYLPISAATGVMGMNLKEINASTPRFWAFLIVFGVFLILTLLAMRVRTIQMFKTGLRSYKLGRKTNANTM